MAAITKRGTCHRANLEKRIVLESGGYSPALRVILVSELSEHLIFGWTSLTREEALAMADDVAMLLRRFGETGTIAEEM